MIEPTKPPKILSRYPFSDSRIQLVEGFSAYDGVIGDEPGATHKGIDYVLLIDGEYRSFDVFSMCEGTAFRGTSESWGEFVIVHLLSNEIRYSVVYAHLSEVESTIAPQLIERDGQSVANEQGTHVSVGQRLGLTGTSGWTNGIIQLHLELHQKELQTDVTQKLDPYGVYDRASSGRYPQPGAPLQGLEHAWVTDEPRLEL